MAVILGVDATLVAIGAVTGLVTLIGGAIAANLKTHRALLMGFGSGAVIAVALLDLLPEALDLGHPTLEPLWLCGLMMVGFLLYMAIDRLTGQSEVQAGAARHLGPASLVAHSLMDGLGIGLAFATSGRAGVLVAIAVLAHDLIDGSNTVTLSVRQGLRWAWVIAWLLLDGLAPLAGIFISHWLSIPPLGLALAISAFAGFFLFIGAGKLLPHSLEGRGAMPNAVPPVLGAMMVAAIVLLDPR